ncbi:MAG TPA: hypothetical protein VIN08_20375 [Ohtaekwangia sp.]|uniref:hypothetical protein n=1 Tax=Ohtaekwangia sp. TaxID=2066019 RepID=UPI002F94E69F
MSERSHKKIEPYNQRKIDMLADQVRRAHQSGEPILYEIDVDDDRVIRRTSDPEMFHMFDEYVDGKTKSVTIKLYFGSSNNNEKYVFTMGGGEWIDPADIKKQIQAGIDQKMREKEFIDLVARNKQLEEQIKELENDIGELEKEKDALIASRSPLSGVIGEIGSSVVESLIKRNPQIIARMPGGEALAGLMEPLPPAVDVEHCDVSYKLKDQSQPKQTPVTTLTEEQLFALDFGMSIRGVFTKDEFDKVNRITQLLAEDKSRLDLIIELLKR